MHGGTGVLHHQVFSTIVTFDSSTPVARLSSEQSEE
jgi:hypothetical protein